jgi:hypothetical protein
LSTTKATPGGGGYICGSDGWEWKYDNATGKVYAYKLFNSSGNYWKCHDICSEYCASPCSVESEEENQYIINNVFSGVLSTNSSKNSSFLRSKRETTDSGCYYTGIHRYQVNPPNGPIKCSTDYGGSCGYGNEDTNSTTSLLSSTTPGASLGSTTKSSDTIIPDASTSASIDKNNPWAHGCPSTPSTGLGDTDGYGNKNCVGYDSNGKWIDRACERPGKGVVCKKECIPPS